MKTIRGITWDHSRAFPPLVAVAQRYEELHPGVRIHWEKRTLDEFGHKPIDRLCNDYDLIVIDHPWADFCFKRKIVYDLNAIIPDEDLFNLSKNCVGHSFDSYIFDDKFLATPIDAATPVPSWRPDLMKKEGYKVPESWEDLLNLADTGKVIMPGFDADLFLNWAMLLYALNGDPFSDPEKVAIESVAKEAAEMLRRLAEKMPNLILELNPIRIGELLTRSDEFIYCPFAYSYNNYSRPSFVKKPLQYGNLVTLNGAPLRSILGGTGIAISSSCRDTDLAVDYSVYCAGSFVQSNIYYYAGGQPAHEDAWEDKELNSFTNSFFENCYESHKNAIVRPCYEGFVQLQKTGGVALQKFIKGGGSFRQLWSELGEAYAESRRQV